MAFKAFCVLLGIGVFAWGTVRLLRPQSYDFRFGRHGLWVDSQYYYWHQLLAVTHYHDQQTLLIKVERTDEVPLAVAVDLKNTRFERLSTDQLREQFTKRVERLSWKSV
ncbi:hypothetical protein [Aeoliella mucimassa]|uniref:Uncharacterized protein n=1 Tax=Aeoliella mucimassa TaxID=2527972 RepID=A0A518ANM1_9BACT|nr:hypothetical protein [Aeoliella mucimassa]QDU56323.1 hypothetical protein Pan181_25320 [Aeoliella mucimassa]